MSILARSLGGEIGARIVVALICFLMIAGFALPLIDASRTLDTMSAVEVRAAAEMRRLQPVAGD